MELRKIKRKFSEKGRKIMEKTTEIVSVLHLSVNYDFIYLTIDDEKPQSSSFILNIRRRDVLVGQNVRVLPRSDSCKDGAADGRPCILAGCDWKNDLESICREGEQKNIRITQEYGEPSNQWEVSWEPEEELLAGVKGCWKLKAPADAELDTEFGVSFLFEVGVSKALQGGAILYVMGQNLPDFPEDRISIITIHKIYPISMQFTKLPPACMEAGDVAEISWEVKNAEYCTLNYIACNLQGTVKEIFRQPETYMLTAQNGKGRIEFLTAHVGKTNWKCMGEIAGTVFWQGEDSSFNRRILAYREELYLYDSGKIYKSGDGLEWECISVCGIREEELPKAYTTALWKDRIYILGDAKGQKPEENKICFYSISRNEWQQETLMTAVENGCCASVFQNDLLYFNLAAKDKILMYRYSGEYWNPDGILFLGKFSFALEEAEAMDSAWCQDMIYLAIKDKNTKTIYLIGSRDGCDWREVRRLDIRAEGWYRLMAAGGNLLLVTDRLVLPLIDTQKQYENYLPQVSAGWDSMPWCGYAGGVLRMIAGEEDKAILWRFRE